MYVCGIVNLNRIRRRCLASADRLLTLTDLIRIHFVFIDISLRLVRPLGPSQETGYLQFFLNSSKNDSST